MGDATAFEERVRQLLSSEADERIAELRPSGRDWSSVHRSRRPRRHLLRLCATAAFVAALTAGTVAAVALGGSRVPATPKPLLKGVHVLGWGFSSPGAAVVANGHLFVANGDDSVIELDATTGALVQVIAGPSYRFNEPTDLAVRDGTLFATSCGGITEIDASTGSLLKVIDGPSYHFNCPGSIVFSGADLFVANQEPQSPDGRGKGTLTEVDATTGALVRVISGPPYDFFAPVLAVSEGHLFVAESTVGASPDGVFQGGDSVTEYDAATGTVVRVISGPSYQFDGTDGLKAVGNDVVVWSGYPGPFEHLTEFDASTGALVRVISGQKYGFGNVSDVAPHGDDLFAMNEQGNSVTELDVRTGALVRVISGAMYRFNGPVALAFSGNDLFVTNNQGNSLSELDVSTWATVRVVAGSSYGFDNPDAELVAGGDLFVVNGDYDGFNSVDEIDTSTGALVRVISGSSYQFNELNGLALSGGELFVVSGAGADPAGAGGSVTEVDVSTGALVRVISDPSFSSPDAVTASGGDVFVANEGDALTPSSVTEIDASTGAVVRVISGPSYKLNWPVALVTSSGDLFVANSGENGGSVDPTTSITEINASTGALMRVISAPWSESTVPVALGIRGRDLFVVVNTHGGRVVNSNVLSSVTDLNTQTGTVVRVIAGSLYHFNDPDALTVSGDNLYVANGAGNSLTEVNASTGALVRVIPPEPFHFDDPDALTLSGGDLFVTNGAGSSVTELPS